MYVYICTYTNMCVNMTNTQSPSHPLYPSFYTHKMQACTKIFVCGRNVYTCICAWYIHIHAQVPELFVDFWLRAYVCTWIKRFGCLCMCVNEWSCQKSTSDSCVCVHMHTHTSLWSFYMMYSVTSWLFATLWSHIHVLYVGYDTYICGTWLIHMWDIRT